MGHGTSVVEVPAALVKEFQSFAYVGSFMAGGGVNPAFAATVLTLRPTAVDDSAGEWASGSESG